MMEMDERMTDERLRKLYARALEVREPGRREECPTPEALLALARREGSEEERLRTLDHVMACTRCRGELDMLRSIDEAGAKVAGTPRTVRHTRWLRYVPFALAASLVLAIGLGPGRQIWQRETPGVVRGPAAEVIPLAPAAEVAAGAPLVFAWRPVPEARRYMLEVLTLDGTEAFAAETTDTLMAVPAGRALAPGEYQWWVRVVATDGTEGSSEMRRLRIRAE